MLFNSTVFLFILLPLALIAYYLVPDTWMKKAVLLAASLIFFAWGEPVYLILLAFSVLFNYVCGFYIGRSRRRRARRFLILNVVVNVAVLVFFRYWASFASWLNLRIDGQLMGENLPVPIGIAIFTLQAISYTVDVYRREVPFERNLLDFSIYIAMFPRMLLGPIATYQEMMPQIKEERQISFDRLGEGLMRFIRGLAKKVILADQAVQIFQSVEGLEYGEISALTAWLGVLVFGFYVYFTFSGYSDMAIGLGKMFGFEFEENFDHPYLAQSVTDFWQRFNSSLSRWFSQYVYAPLGAQETGVLRNLFNMLLVWTLMGMWYGTSLNVALWGLFCGIIILLEGYVFGGIIDAMPGVVKVIVTNLLMLVSWVFFFSPNVGDAGTYLGYLFGAGGGGLADGIFLYLVRTHLLPLALCIVFILPWPRQWFERLTYGGERGRVALNAVVYGALLLLCAIYVIAGNMFLF